MTSELWRKKATAIEAEADALWEEYFALADEIDGLRWWNRWRRESELRARLHKNRLQRDALDHRLSALDMIGDQEAV
jgi:hypothetical protein